MWKGDLYSSDQMETAGCQVSAGRPGSVALRTVPDAVVLAQRHKQFVADVGEQCGPWRCPCPPPARAG